MFLSAFTSRSYAGESSRPAVLCAENRSGHQFPVAWGLYHCDQKLTEEELARVMGLLNTEAGDYAIAHVNTNMGFSAGLIVCKIETVAMEYTAEVVLCFTERQFPAKVNWEKMAEVYMGERNLELLALIGIDKPVPDQSRYDY